MASTIPRPLDRGVLFSITSYVRKSKNASQATFVLVVPAISTQMNMFLNVGVSGCLWVNGRVRLAQPIHYSLTV